MAQQTLGTVLQPGLEVGKQYRAPGSHCQSHLDLQCYFTGQPTNTELPGERTQPWFRFCLLLPASPWQLSV